MPTKTNMRSIVAAFAVSTIAGVNAANIPVTNLNDSGPGSFRQAILDANDEVTNPGLDIIDLSVIKNPKGPVVTIQPLSPLPPITSPVHIDGSINETRPGLPGDIILNAGAGFSLSDSGPSLRPGVELDGSVAISTDESAPGFYIFPFNGFDVACDDPSHVAGSPCYAPDAGNPEIFVFEDETRIRKILKASVHGLWLKEHSGSTLRGLVINRFSGHGVFITAGGGHAILGNYNGTDATGTVGGTTVGAAGASGTYLVADNDPGSATYGWIERDETDSGDGTIAYGNGFPVIYRPPSFVLLPFDGIRIYNSSDNRVGGLSANDRNVLSATVEALNIFGRTVESGVPPGPADRNEVIGNFVGTGTFGDEPLGNVNHGIIAADLGFSSGPPPQQSMVNDTRIIGNVVSDTGFNSPFAASLAPAMGASGTVNTLIAHNHVGTDVTGLLPLGNVTGGISEIQGFYNIHEKNVISANGSLTSGSSSSAGMRFIEGEGSIVRGNHIGTDITGMMPLGNGQWGIQGIAQSEATFENNLVSANRLSGIRLTGGDNVVVKGNTIGARVDKNASAGGFANGGYGVLSIGIDIGPFQGAPATNGQYLNNFIANNALAGITATFNEDLLIEGNTIIMNGYANGLTIPGFGVVDGAGNFGIEILNQSARVELVNNSVGIDPRNPEDSAMGNAKGGISVGSTTFLQLYPSSGVPPFVVPQHLLVAGLVGQPIGPTEVAILENTVAYNGGTGVLVGGDVDEGVTDFCTYAPLCIDPLTNAPTVLPYNDGFPGNSVGVTILGNAIFSNEGLGIDLTKAHQTGSIVSYDIWRAVASAPDGVTANDAADVDTGPNGSQNYPVIAEGVAAGNHLNWVSGTLDSDPGHYRIEFFVNDQDDSSGYGEGQKFAGFLENDFQGPGPHSFSLVCNGVDPANGCRKVDTPTPVHKLNLTATATNLDTGNTSEFSLNFALDSK
jgi:parallel beta-helix repeat protein